MNKANFIPLGMSIGMVLGAFLIPKFGVQMLPLGSSIGTAGGLILYIIWKS